ncbi:apolipoprotein acyltransferase [Sulfitobacter sp. S223]|uniref:apolipoprotein acyltransferase n=1 Tax=Sulfitobacter sp. S223 TaxID=2867023 RepID=UPI0021A6A23E|nr:apolipoprotein acyltransferase [Sulfitobacter sp. S223]UWR24809.1 apolipoprotein acyltransferase [Sulfitobacter sp. S223]
MIVIGLAIIGALIGGMTARKRRGNRKDIAQYAIGYGMAFLIVGMFLTVIIDRLTS